MSQMLTVAEKILFHLSQYLKSEEKYEVPFDITQDGIAQACGISRAHAAIELKKLRESEHVIEKLSHVRQARSRRKVYFLTQFGKGKALKIVEHVRQEGVDTGVDPSRIRQGTGPAKRPRRRSLAIPQPKRFFGRERELSILHSIAEDDVTEIIAVMGLGGIGKTALLARFARESRSSVFWFSLNEWDTELSLLKALAGFLDECGDNRLANYLKSDRVDLGEVSYLLADALTENRRLFFFDDVDKAPRMEAIVKMVVQNLGPNRVIVSMEASHPIIDELKGAGKSVQSIMLEGLDEAAAIELLDARGIEGEAAKRLYLMTGGHPLLLGLVPIGDESTARIELSNYVKKNLLKGLPVQDIAIIERCSVLRKPFSSNYLSRDERPVLKLPIFYQMSGAYDLHELVRQMIYDHLTEAERAEHHSSAADYFLSEGNVPERLYHLIQASRFIEAEMLIHSKAHELVQFESPQNLLDELDRIPPRVSKYAASRKLLSARVSSALGDDKTAIENLLRLIETEAGDGKAEALLELSSRPLNDQMRTLVATELESMLVDERVSPRNRSRIALALATMKFNEGELDDCERFVNLGLSKAAGSFSVDVISALNRLLGQLLILKERYPEVVSILAQTAQSFEGQHRPLYHRLMGRAMIEMGMLGEARTNLVQGIEVAEKNGLFKELADSLLELSQVHMAESDFGGAAETCYRCIEVSSSLDDSQNLALAYSNLSIIEEQRGNTKEAEESRTMAKSIADEKGLPVSLLINPTD